MDKPDEALDETTPRADLSMSISRAQLLGVAGAGLATMLLPQAAAAQGASGSAGPPVLTFPFYPPAQARYEPEGIMEILNTYITVNYLLATRISALFKAGLVTPLPQEPAGSQLRLRNAQAELANAQYAIDFLSSLGATPLTTTFTQSSAPPIDVQSAHVAMYAAGVREFAEIGQPTLAKWSFQLGATWSQSLAILRNEQVLSGNLVALPTKNRAFQTDLLLYVRDVLTIYKSMGLIGGSGSVIVYPGRDAVLATAGPVAAAMIQRIPNNAGSSAAYTGPGSLAGERK